MYEITETRLRKQLQELEKKYPEGLKWDTHYLAWLIYYSDDYRRQEVRSVIRWWESNLAHGCSNRQEVQAIITELKGMIDYTE